MGTSFVISVAYNHRNGVRCSVAVLHAKYEREVQLVWQCDSVTSLTSHLSQITTMIFRVQPRTPDTLSDSV